MFLRSKTRKRSSEATLASIAAPDPDRARAIASSIAATVQSTAWALARYDDDGDVSEFVVDPNTVDGVLTPEVLETETALQMREVAGAPLVAPTKVSIAPLRFGMTAVFGRRQVIAATLVLARSASGGPFAAKDRAAIVAALDRTTEQLQKLSAFGGEQAAITQIEQRRAPAQFFLNERLEVEASWCPEGEGDELLDAMLDADRRLPPAIDRAVRAATRNWTDNPTTWRESVSLPLPFLIVRVFPLLRPGAKPYVSVHVERYQARNALRTAVTRYQLSAREVEVLSLMLQGRGSIEIAHALSIAESTVNDHIKRLLAKTHARNRVDLAAKALGWRAPSRIGLTPRA